MKLQKGQITIMVHKGETTIEITDLTASTTFVKVVLTSEQFCAALGRLGYVNCDVTVSNLDKVGKIHENKYFEFEINKEQRETKNSGVLNQACLKALKAEGMEEWQPDNYYSSQNSFFTKDDKQFARAVIRRWI